MNEQVKKSNAWKYVLIFGCGVPAGLFVIFLIGCFGIIGMGIEEEVKKEEQRNKEVSSALKEAKPGTSGPIVSDSFYAVVNELEDEKTTDLQRKAIWDSKYKNQLVKWSGTIVEVREGGEVLVKVRPNTITYDFRVSVQPSEMGKVMAMKKDEAVTVTGILTTRGDALSSYKLENCVIAESQ